MSSYTYTINFRDGGKVVLEEALGNLISLCEQKLESGDLVPYTAYQIMAENMLEQISRNKITVKVGTEEDEESFGIFKEIQS